MNKDAPSPLENAVSAGNGCMGHAEYEEILAALTELLEAERAGARVAMAMAASAAGTVQVELMRAVRADEARWCAMLSHHTRRLGGSPSRETGAFHEKAMALADHSERLALLSRGQAWVVRKIEALLPLIRDEELHADLSAMAQNHRDNFEAAQNHLSGKQG